jgi:hypothetical protein
MVVARDGGGEVGSWCLMGTAFKFCKMRELSRRMMVMLHGNVSVLDTTELHT